MLNTYANFISNLNNNLEKNKFFFYNRISKKVINLLNLFMKEGFIKNYKLKNNKVKIYLKYNNKLSIKHVKLISSIHKSIWINNQDLKFYGDAVLILSNSLGLMTNYSAKKLGLGGKIICKILC